MISKRLLHLFYIETPQLGKIGTTPSTLHSPCDHHSTSHSPQRQSEVFKQSLLEYQKAHNCPRRLSHKVKSVLWFGKDTVPWRSWSIILSRNLRQFVFKKRHNSLTKNMQYVTQYVNVLSIPYIKNPNLITSLRVCITKFLRIISMESQWQWIQEFSECISWLSNYNDPLVKWKSALASTKLYWETKLRLRKQSWV